MTSKKRVNHQPLEEGVEVVEKQNKRTRRRSMRTGYTCMRRWKFMGLVMMLLATFTMVAMSVLYHTSLDLELKHTKWGLSQQHITESKKYMNPELWMSATIGEKFYKCINRARKDHRDPNATKSGYMLFHANGGLNQMKTGISDMVAIAKIMNATLVLPSLDHDSFWDDPSGFKDIFDWRHFMEVLKDDIEIVESLPKEFANIKPLQKAPVSWSKASYYRENIAALLRKHKVINLTHSDTRLANNASAPIQRLRCRAMFEALRFSDGIEALGKKLVNRIREDGKPFMALHLRYEKDMLAFTGCSHSLTQAEDKELENMRKENKNWKEKKINGVAQRLEGSCPLTPREVALFLDALGYPNGTNIYIVAGEIYGQNGMKPLQEKYPNLHTHFSLATEEELRPFKGFQNQLAAIDYTVAVESDVFVYTYFGNMAKVVVGQRKIEGFRKAIGPKRHKLVNLIDQLDNGKITWHKFASKVREAHRDRSGLVYPRERNRSPRHEEYFYSNPYPECICQRPK